MHLKDSLTFQADPGLVWSRVSSVAEIPKYWHGTRSLEVTHREGEKIYARLRFAFGGSGDAELTTDAPRRTLTINYVSGPFRGVQIITVGENEISATWDVRFSGVFRLASPWNEGHFRSGTRHALERLVAPLNQ